MTITAVRVSGGNIAANLMFLSGTIGLVNAIPSKKSKIWRSKEDVAMWVIIKVARRETNVPLVARKNVKKTDKI